MTTVNQNIDSTTTTEIAIELTDDERLELIKLLINTDEKENN